MNGRPLLKCLSITFECSLSLTSEQHTHRARTHKQAHTHTYPHQGLYLCMEAMHRRSAIFPRRGGIFFPPHAPIQYFGDSSRIGKWEERSSGGRFTANPAVPGLFFGCCGSTHVQLRLKQHRSLTRPCFSCTLSQYTHHITLGKKSKAGWIFVIVNKSLDKAKTNNVLAPASTLKYFPV